MDYQTYFEGMHTPFLAGEVAVITDGDSETGLAAAKAMLELGACVAAAVSAEGGTAPSRLSHERFLPVPTSLASAEDAEGLIAAAAERFGRLDILVNNCDRFSGESIADSRDGDWDSSLEVNLKRAYWCSKFATREFIPRRYGKIVNLTSVLGKSGQVAVGVEYAAAKSALLGFTKMLAKQLGEYHITVNAVAVGLLDSQTELVNANRDLLPLGRGAALGEIAGPVVYLSSRFSDYITGYCMDVNGGMYLD